MWGRRVGLYCPYCHSLRLSFSRQIFPNLDTAGRRSTRGWPVRLTGTRLPKSTFPSGGDSLFLAHFGLPDYSLKEECPSRDRVLGDPAWKVLPESTKRLAVCCGEILHPSGEAERSTVTCNVSPSSSVRNPWRGIPTHRNSQSDGEDSSMPARSPTQVVSELVLYFGPHLAWSCL